MILFFVFVVFALPCLALPCLVCLFLSICLFFVLFLSVIFLFLFLCFSDRWEWKADRLAKKNPNFFGGYLLKIPGNVAMGEERFFFLALFLVICGLTRHFTYFPSSLDQHCPTKTTDLRSRDRGNPWSLLFAPDKSHECGWQRWRVYLDPCPWAGEVACAILWSSVASSQNSVFRPLGYERFFVSVFYTPAAKCALNRSLIGARHKSLAVEWALYTEGGSEPLTSSPRSAFATLSLISSNEVCGEHKMRRI